MSTKTVDSIVSALQSKKGISNKDYQRVYRVCKKVSSKVFNQYGMNSIVHNPHLKEEIIEDVATMSLVKSIKGFNPEKKAKFFTYYYNKARSATRVHAMKCHRRYHLINASSLDAFNDKESQED